MEKPKRILAACDDSSQAVGVATYAAFLASRITPRLILARAIPQRDVKVLSKAIRHFSDASKDFNEAVSTYTRDKINNGHKELRNLLSGHRNQHLEVETVVRAGVPHEVLLDLVVEKKIDLMVVGASRYVMLPDWILGSTVNHLFRHCPVPLISARRLGALASEHQVEMWTPAAQLLGRAHIHASMR